MADTCSNTVRRYAEIHADANGIAQTPIPGLTLVRECKIGIVVGRSRRRIKQGAASATSASVGSTRTAIESAEDTELISTISPSMMAGSEITAASEEIKERRQWRA